MTDVQRDVWIACQMGRESSAAFNDSTTLDLKGDLDVDALHEALRLLVSKYDALRTTFDEAGEHQIVNRTVEVALPVFDVSDEPESERARRITAFVDAELTTPYDLVGGPLFRAVLIESGDTDHTLVLSAHHLVCDGWSFGILQRDLGATYSAVIASERTSVGGTAQFSEYALWHIDRSTRSEHYWLGLYDDPPKQLDLPIDKARPPVRTFEYGTQRVAIGEGLLSALNELAAYRGVSLFIVLLAGWEIMLHRLSGQVEFAHGVFVPGQIGMGVPEVVGPCANLLPLRARITPDERLSDYLMGLYRATVDGIDNQCYSVGRLASALRLPRDASRPALVSSAFTMEDLTEAIDFDGLEAGEPAHGRRSYGGFDLEAFVTERKAGLTVALQYSTALFEPDTMRRWLRYYTHLLEDMAADATVPISELRLLDAAARRELLVEWNETAAPVPDQAIIGRVERQAAQHPDRVAIRASGESVTYGDLNARANRPARSLRDIGVEAERTVGVHVDRSPDMAVGLLAVHKAGGAYVPLDPMFPPERLATIAADAGLHALVTNRQLAEDIRAEGAIVVALDGDATSLAELDDSDLGIAPAPSDLAYVISTSGSTGRPKGVEITHLALTNQLTSMQQEPGLATEDVLLAVTTMSFDPALLEVLLPLMVGATVVLADAKEAVDAIWLRDRLAANDITVMQATPATWQMLVDAGWQGTPGLKALCGGEALTPDLAAAVTARVDSLWNVYGTTETTIWSSVSKVSRDGGLIPLGPPIANTEFHVLDRRLEPQPPGVPGDLYIGGVGLARGYRNQPGLTEDRFIMHSFDDEPPRRLYRTGDLARRLADGRIEFLGRDDFQVKIRGFRIELGEVETVLARHAVVRECVLVARAEADVAKRLVAFIVPAARADIRISELRTYLRGLLPEYMVPSVFVTLDALPLSANRKVDRSRLPEPDGHRPALVTELVEPRTETEAGLARIWEKLLGIEQVGVEDNFFELGGDSLTALRCMVDANRSGMSLAPNAIFQYQTIADLALAAAEAGESAIDDQGVVSGPVPLTPAQLRFLTERGTSEAHHWNLAALVRAESLSTGALRTAIGALLVHHDALRLRLWQEGGRWRQEIVAPPEDVPLETHDLSRLSAQERVATIERVCSEMQGSFDLGEGVLLKAAHFDCGPDETDRLFLAIHHFAVDGLTWPVIWEDLEQAYRQADEGVRVSLPPKTTSIRSWAIQLDRLVQTPRIIGTEPEWMRKPWPEVTRLPLDHEADPKSNTNGSTAVVELELSPDDTRALLGNYHRPEHVLVAALARSLSSWTSSPTVLIDVLSHGRDAALPGVNLSRTVGFTLSYNPLVLTHPTWDGTPGTLEAVARQIDAGPEGFSFELLRLLAGDEASRDRLSALPRAEVLFNYLGAVDGPGTGSRWRAAPEPIGPSESPAMVRQYPIAVRAELEPHLRLTFVYSTALHTAATVGSMAADVASTIRRLARDLATTP